MVLQVFAVSLLRACSKWDARVVPCAMCHVPSARVVPCANRTLTYPPSRNRLDHLQILSMKTNLFSA